MGRKENQYSLSVLKNVMRGLGFEESGECLGGFRGRKGGKNVIFTIKNIRNKEFMESILHDNLYHCMFYHLFYDTH